jgi:predicted methyltransferase
MNCVHSLLSFFLFSPGDDGGGAVSNEAIAQAVNHPARLQQDLSRDAGRKPAEVLAFFQIEPGMTVLDLFAGGGYYTELLHHTVGEKGRVISHNNQAYLDYSGAELKQRFVDGKLERVEQITAEADELEFEDHSLDAAMLVLTWHDFYFSDDSYAWPDADEQLLLKKLCKAMKPGAVLGVIDHVANPGGDVSEIAKGLHRIDPERVKSDIAGSCFELQAESAVLANPADDHTKPMSAKGLRGNTDRFVFRYVRREL